MTGYTHSTDFPLKNPLQSSCSTPCNSPFLTKFDSAGSSLVYSTYLGIYPTTSLASLWIRPETNLAGYMAIDGSYFSVNMNQPPSLAFIAKITSQQNPALA